MEAPARRSAALPLLAAAWAFCACAPAIAAQPQLQQQLAHAQAANGGQLLYREQHLLRSEGQRPLERLVLYRCPGGAVFARKRVDYAASAQAPAFELVDARSGYREGLRRKGGQVALFFRAPGAAAETDVACQDPHEAVRRQPQVIEQKKAFFQPSGTINNVCRDEPCQAKPRDDFDY